MLDPSSKLQKVVVEGPSLDDKNTGGEDVIDLALYYGCGDLQPERVAYRCLSKVLSADFMRRL
jgi:hypothetical protein